MMRSLLIALFLIGTTSAFAQTETPVQNAQLAAAPATADQQGTPVVEPKPLPPVPQNTDAGPPSYEAKKYAVLQTLDKLTARTKTVTLPVGQPSAVGPIFIDVKTCQKTPQDELPESAAFLQVWEAKTKTKEKHVADDNAAPSQWVFSGWMFASSPALSAMDHPVYDVWLKDCVNEIASSKQK